MSKDNPIVEEYLEAIVLADDGDVESKMSMVREWYFAIAFTIMREFGEDAVPESWKFEPSDFDRARIDIVDDHIEQQIQSHSLETLIEAGEQVIEDGELLEDELDTEDPDYDVERTAEFLRSVGYSTEVAEQAASTSTNIEDAVERAVILGGR